MTPEEATKKLSNYEFWKNNPTVEEIQECIKSGANLKEMVRMFSDRRPLAYMAAAYLPEAIPMLVKAGMDINQEFMEGSYFFSSAAMAPISYMIKAKGFKSLLENGGKLTMDPCSSYPEDLLNIIYCEIGGMSDDPDDKFAEDTRQKLKLLLQSGIIPDKLKKNSWFLEKSIGCGEEKASQIILDCGADINARYNGDTILTMIGKRIIRAYRGQYYMSDGATGLRDATPEEKDEQVAIKNIRPLAILLSKGADITLSGKDGVSFENSPAAKIPFVAEMIKAYHEKGGKGVIETAEKIATNFWKQEKYKEWSSHYKWYPMSADSDEKKGLRKRLRSPSYELADDAFKKGKDLNITISAARKKKQAE